ncbi:HNH endonuclease [Klebsiella aerogenes]|nr:HNH endonuclease [Klebsiella aerogenes]
MFKDVDNVKRCFYCGDDSQITRDHVIPVSYTGGKRHYDRNDVVDCCKECNCTLGDKPLFTVEGRAQYLFERYSQKYKKIIHRPVWGEDELKGMSLDFRRTIKAEQREKEYQINRLNNLYKIALSEYEAGEIKHLTGLVTRDKVAIYKVISLITSIKGKKDDVLAYAAEKAQTTIELASEVMKGKHSDVWLIWMHERHIPLDVKPTHLLRAMQRDAVDLAA